MLGNHVPELTQDVCIVTAWVLSSRRSLFSFHQIFSMSNFCNHMIPLSFWGPQVSHFCQYCNPWLCHKYGIKLNFTYRMSVDACSQFHWNTLLCVVWLVDGCMMCVVWFQVTTLSVVIVMSCWPAHVTRSPWRPAAAAAAVCVSTAVFHCVNHRIVNCKCWTQCRLQTSPRQRFPSHRHKLNSTRHDKTPKCIYLTVDHLTTVS